ncbi:hypothetical protein DPMN_146334 [Dreissena polymorpha]|uniref:Uncharacterized protein n=1 Tax=Dreissena polymorpha TaxID=45954 RepID=A0A9D4F5Q5_DREPO|nr:hypothetical protein DPMN_146334 [Dreissena polymorpha]
MSIQTCRKRNLRNLKLDPRAGHQTRLADRSESEAVEAITRRLAYIWRSSAKFRW